MAKNAAFELLREEALQHEVDLVDADGNEHPEAVLRTLVDDAIAAEKAAHEADKAVASAAQGKTPSSPPGAPGGRKGGPKPRGTAKPASGLRARIGKPEADLLERLGLGEPTDADYQLADQHGYPIAIPGAKAYRTAISIYDIYSRTERPAGSVMLMTDAFASNKLEHLTPL